MNASQPQSPLKIAIAGLGTVGVGVIKIIQQHGDLLRRRCGRSIEIVAVSARDARKDRGVSIGDAVWFDDAAEMARSADADVFVELIGGSEGIAKDAVEAALARGLHVVTANKALVAHHGTALARAAEGANVSLNYEAAVAGGIPVIKALREGLAGNAIHQVYGILNGTCNYILSEMRDTGRDFDDVLADAQAAGYAEADPAFDVDGVDAAHKLAILASVAFGCEPDFDAVYTEGIRHISPLDIRFADELGYRIKLLGVAKRSNGGIEQQVHPCMVPADAPIANVEGVFNAVVCEGDFVDTVMQEGRGAGEGPTASAVIADVVDIARGVRVPTFAIPADQLEKLPTVAMDQHRGAYYIRLTVVDRPGVFADVAAALSNNDVSMESVLQHGRAPGEPVSVVMTVHETEESSLMRVIDAFSAMDAVVEPPRLIRIVTF